MSNKRIYQKLLNKEQVGGPTPTGLSIVNIDAQQGTSAMTHTLTGVPVGALLVITTANQTSQQNCAVSSSPALTWTKRVDATSPGSPNAEIWTAVYAAGGAINVTVNWGSNIQTSVCYTVVGQEPVLGGAFATGVVQETASVPIATTKTNSIVFCVSSNWNAPTIPLTYRLSPVEAYIYRDPAHGTWPHYYYNVPVVGAVNPTAGVGYSAPIDGDNGTSTAVLEIRSDGGVPGNNAPVANAGPNQTIVQPASSVNLSGSLSTDDTAITSYLWTRISGPNTPIITTPTLVNTSVTGLIAGVYVFRLTVSDGTLTNTDDVQITVNTIGNTAPIANAGTNQNITLPTSSVTLDSSTSTDDVAITSRTWTRTSGPNIPTIVSPNGITTNVTGLIAGVYIFRISVFDAGALSSFDEVQITVSGGPNSAPSAPILSSTGHTQTTVDLSWTAATDDVGVANYRIYRNNVLINTVSNATLTYTATGLTDLTAYDFRVEAVDTPGLFTTSNTVNVTTGLVNPVIPFTFTALTNDYRRYWGGGEEWGGRDLERNLGFIQAHRYRRFVWNDWEGSPAGSYRFAENFGNSLKNFIDAGIVNKQLVSFGIMTCYPGFESDNSFHTRTVFGGIGAAYPTYLHNLMQAEAIPDWENGDCWTPSYNSPNYISRFTALMVALNAFLNTTHSSGIKYGDAVGYIDLRGMGAYGEWHSYGSVVDNPVADLAQYPGFAYSTGTGNKVITSYGAFATPASLIQIIDAQRLNLPDWPLTTILNSLDGNFPNGGTDTYSGYFGTGLVHTGIPISVGQYILNNGNAWGPIGRRRDQWGDTSNYYVRVSEETNGLTGNPTRWQTSPINGEPPGYAVPYPCNPGTMMQAFPAQAETQHASIVGNSNYGGCNPTSGAMETAFRSMGCILRLVTGGGLTFTPTQMQIQTLWRNFGVAPQYKKDWQVTFEIRTLGGTLVWSGLSSLNLYSNPGLKSNTGSNVTMLDTFTKPVLGAGTYQLSVVIRDPKGYLEPLQLGINGRQTPSGAYILTNVTF